MTPIRVRLREVREGRGLTQQQLGDLAGVRQATISELETGEKKRLGLDVLDALCEALKCDPGELLEREKRVKRAK